MPTTNTTTIEIPLSKTKLTKLLIFSIIFLCAGAWMFFSDAQIDNPVFGNPVVKTFGSIGGMIMGALGIYYFTKKLLDKKPGLLINEQGIIDNVSAFKFGLIPWSEITAIYDQSVQASIASKQHFLTIGLANPDEYISREKNVLKRKLLVANSSIYGSPVHISTNGLAISHKELLEILSKCFEKYSSERPVEP